ncbi:outer membrane lipid asymmetry maintenance protein MlaD [Solidesulfovibrio sp.]|jgi:phospholipid/cholesterol/gamma-HCH transport system substrate-binding protein|uniref:outer membrane lipid asymmetry maintenance protein MlaD n=1 Tax=Solidesulfovibrio sp. TaxID=2910990 RepID=UPI000EDF591D|nr:outer membrane lipid asymmetry maintenance protein MlaD [Solidesulfovibrio sp.]MEA5090242.1 outer membrane lipid asymmetry maintenance protein MlaD [Solidesulfovibrio sp.]HCR11983.1 outer membrane lipid asymmetry maintenance protein MlaD [Desulfovibrio sp.]HML60585.1 outer membrane lipid asymmetry maintenance protein MlaD [Solidesulfovibrio sp.]
MKKYSMETTVGIFVLAGLMCVAYLTVKLGKLDVLGGDRYPVTARFKDVTGLKSGAYVEMAGVRIGRVAGINLDTKANMALVTLEIDKGVRLTDDSIASIKTSGLIGDKFVKISPGGSDDVLGPGGLIVETEPSVDLGDLIGKYVFGGVK